MSILSVIFGEGAFNKLTKGRFDLQSGCGFSEECKQVKECINRVCVPYEQEYGGLFFDNCINYCNADYRAVNIDEILCHDPAGAFNNYSYVCKGFNPATTGNYLNIGDYSFKYTTIITAVLVAIILYIILTKFLK
jgi:hypothetical protein